MPELARVFDANLNRAREGLRVIEDTLRYIHNDNLLANECKLLRHSIKSSLFLSVLLPARDIDGDVSKKSIDSEIKRENLNALMLANFKRVQESARVLEEYAKLLDSKNFTKDSSLAHSPSEHFKSIRYKIYGLEKSYFEKYSH